MNVLHYKLFFRSFHPFYIFFSDLSYAIYIRLIKTFKADLEYLQFMLITISSKIIISFLVPNIDQPFFDKFLKVFVN